MNTREIAVEYRQSHWAQIIRDRTESGLTIKDYCASNDIQENAYYYWLKKLRETACEEIARIQGRPAGIMTPVFAEVKLTNQATILPSTSIYQSNVCVEAAGVRITAGGEYPIEKLTELLRIVSRSC